MNNIRLALLLTIIVVGVVFSLGCSSCCGYVETEDGQVLQGEMVYQWAMDAAGIDDAGQPDEVVTDVVVE